jgi:glutathione S-transferase
MIELWHEWNSVQSFKVRVVLAEKKLPWTEHRIELLKFEHLQPSYLALNPNGVVPTLIHDGKVVLESSVICQYLDEVFPEPALMPQDPYARAQARMWLKVFDDVVHPAVRQASFELLYRPVLAQMPPEEFEARLARHPNPVRAQRFRDAAGGAPDAAATKEATLAFRGFIARMNAALEQNEWLASADFSLADVAMAPFLDRLENLGMMNLMESLPHTKRWGAAMMARPAIVSARTPPGYRLPLHSAARPDEAEGS